MPLQNVVAMHMKGRLVSDRCPASVISASKPQLPSPFHNDVGHRRAGQTCPPRAVVENEAASRTRQKSNSIVDLAEEELSGTSLAVSPLPSSAPVSPLLDVPASVNLSIGPAKARHPTYRKIA